MAIVCGDGLEQGPHDGFALVRHLELDQVRALVHVERDGLGHPGPDAFLAAVRLAQVIVMQPLKDSANGKHTQKTVSLSLLFRSLRLKNPSSIYLSDRK